MRSLRPLIKVLIICLVLLVLGLVLSKLSTQSRSSSLKLGGQTFGLEVVKTSAEQTQGLSGRNSFVDRGMLFAYQDSGQRCMWMKDMRFNIDILWLDASDKIVSAIPDLSPQTYPQTYCNTSRNVLELPAGTINRYNLHNGQKLQIHR